jgi:hypothetical protein
VEAPQGLKTWGVLGGVGIVGAARALFGLQPAAPTTDPAAAKTALSCVAPRHHDCTFYGACIEANVSCGPTGYALGFGEKYCERFKSATFSESGAAWADAVMFCLELAIVPYGLPDSKSASCDEITRVAFDSHPACYTAKPDSICFLPPPDVLAVFDTIGADEVFAARTREQIQAVIATCTVQVAKDPWRRLGRGAVDGPPPVRSPGPGAHPDEEHDAGHGVAHDAGHGVSKSAQLAFWNDLAVKYQVPVAKPTQAPAPLRGPNDEP